MAIQNFVAGGFYGKLGQLVGQRWKNKRTIRTYTIPTNPRTPAQQANRGVFAEATRYAQMAMSMNWKAPQWDTTAVPLWGQRVKRARELLSTTQNVLDKVPIYPLDFVPEYGILAVYKTGTQTATSITLSVVGTLPSVNRAISVLVGYLNEETGLYDIELFSSTLIIGAEATFTIQGIDTSKINENTVISFCSNDDVDFSNEAVFCPQTTFATLTTDWDSNILSVSRSGTTFTITFAEEAKEITSHNVTASIFCVSRGKWVTVSPVLTLGSSGGNLTAYFTQSVLEENSEIYAFPYGSTITINGSIVSGGNTLTPINTSQQSTQNDDLTREWNNTVTLQSVSEDSFVISLVDKVTSASTTYTIKTLVGGRFTGADYTQNFQAVGSFSDMGNEITVPKPDSGTISVLQLTADSVITMESPLVSNGVSYSPKITTAQAIPYSNDKLTVNLFPSVNFNVASPIKYLRQQLGLKLGSKYSSRSTFYNAVNSFVENNWGLGLFVNNITEGVEDSMTINDYLDTYSGNNANSYLAGWLDMSGYGSDPISNGDEIDLEMYFDTMPYNATITVGSAKFFLSKGILSKMSYEASIGALTAGMAVNFI